MAMAMGNIQFDAYKVSEADSGEFNWLSCQMVTTGDEKVRHWAEKQAAALIIGWGVPIHNSPSS